ncbi:MAG TPA: hypothetical protein VLS94_08360 [Fusibacter sp.]|nr:hypothetical protein [Fusibacter sp.]
MTKTKHDYFNNNNDSINSSICNTICNDSSGTICSKIRAEILQRR